MVWDVEVLNESGCLELSLSEALGGVGFEVLNESSGCLELSGSELV